MTLARTLMVQGTASSVGKSLLVTGLCRYFARRGLRVAPFKGLNMALNAHVTAQGLEMARAQAVQAEAAGIEPTVEMNPLLLKPEGDTHSQLVLLGKAQGVRSARALLGSGSEVRAALLGALESLRSQYDLVVIEGAGSPAEINLRERDVANMFIARAADAPVLLVGDIDRGGVLAAFVGTLALLEPEDRARVAALWVNKFRGDLSLLTPGLDWLTQHTGKPIFGVLPHLGRLCIAEEDSLNVEARASAKPRAGQHQLEICVLRLPRISNHDEFQPFEHEPDVTLTFSEDPERALAADLVIVPGTKSTVSDLAWLRERGLDHVLCLRARLRRPVLGICGGCQLLGRHILDPHAVESSEARSEGLGLLALSTEFQREKRTRRVHAQPLGRGVLFRGAEHLQVPGYFIHAGVTCAEGPGLFALEAEGLRSHDGTVDESGAVMGTMIHGLFEHDALRHHAIDQLRGLRGLSAASERARWDRHADYERLADAIAQHCDSAWLNRLVAI